MIYLNSDHLNNKQVNVHYSDVFTVQMFAIQIPTVLERSVQVNTFRDMLWCYGWVDLYDI